MRYVGLLAGLAAVLAIASAANATTLFQTGIDSMNYSITTWSIRTGWKAERWNAQTPEYFMFDTSWGDRYIGSPGSPYPAYSQAMSGTAVVTDVFSQADLLAVVTPGPGWATMSGDSSPISIWEHGGQFLQASGGNDNDWADDTYYASNEYGSPRSTGVVTEFTGTFTWDGSGPNGVIGDILADDKAEVYLNNTLIYTTDTRAYDAVEAFSYPGVLVLGANPLKVIVYDTGQGSASQSPTAGATALQLDLKLVPEPVTMAGLMLGIGCLARYARRRRA